VLGVAVAALQLARDPDTETVATVVGVAVPCYLGALQRRPAAAAGGERPAADFGDGGQVLSGWMDRHPRACWMSHPRPWSWNQRWWPGWTRSVPGHA
jgi:hypothetical protein